MVVSQNSFNPCADDNNGPGIRLLKDADLNQLEPSGDNEHENALSSVSEVDCPVCGSKIPGVNNEINAHLGMWFCLWVFDSVF